MALTSDSAQGQLAATATSPPQQPLFSRHPGVHPAAHAPSLMQQRRKIKPQLLSAGAHSAELESAIRFLQTHPQYAAQHLPACALTPNYAPQVRVRRGCMLQASRAHLRHRATRRAGLVIRAPAQAAMPIASTAELHRVEALQAAAIPNGHLLGSLEAQAAMASLLGPLAAPLTPPPLPQLSPSQEELLWQQCRGLGQSPPDPALVRGCPDGEAQCEGAAGVVGPTAELLFPSCKLTGLQVQCQQPASGNPAVMRSLFGSQQRQ